MSNYYNSQRKRGLYKINSKEPFKLSRSKIDLFLECPRCFYIDRKLGIGRPPGFPFTLNSAVDKLLKQEFDIHRAKNSKHPLMEKYGIDAIPYQSENFEKWRNNFLGIQYLHSPTNYLITGAIDDLWQNLEGELIIVDYKATAIKDEIKELDKEWHKSYKRQMEIYQWLFRKNNFKVSNVGYFVYCNGKTDVESFDGKLEFDITLISHNGNDSWVEKTIFDIHKCLNEEKIPESNTECDYCRYIKSINNLK